MSSASAQQYVLYASLILGAVGTYGTLLRKSSRQSSGEDSMANLFETGDVSSFSTALSELSADMRSVTSQSSELESSIHELKQETSLAVDFVTNFSKKETTLHSRVKDAENALAILAGKTKTTVAGDTGVASQAFSLLESSLESIQEVSYAARDKADLNSGNIAQLKTTMSTLTKDAGTVSSLSSSVDSLNTRVDLLSLTDVKHDMKALSLRNDNVEERLAGMETWMHNKINSGRVEDNSSDGTTITTDNSRIVDIEALVDINAQHIVSIAGKVDTNSLDIATFTPDFQEQLTTTKSDMNVIGTQVDTTLATLNDVVLVRLDHLDARTLELKTIDIGIGSRIEALELAKPLESAERAVLAEDIVRVSERVTANTTKIDGIEDTLTGEHAEGIKAATDSILDIDSRLNRLLGVVYPTEEEKEVHCDAYLRALAGAELWNAKIGLFNDNNWLIYRAIPTTSNQLTTGLGFAGAATRVRVYHSANEGFIVENSSQKPLLTVRGSDGLTGIAGVTQIDTACVVMQDSDGGASFGHWALRETQPALTHRTNKTITLGSDDCQRIYMKCGNENKIAIRPDRTYLQKPVWMVNEEHNGQATGSTVFQTQSNFIVTGTGERTYFGFGKNNKSVSVRENEITINGTDVLAKLNELNSKIQTLETTMKNDYVKKGSEYYIKGAKDNWGTELGYSGYDARWHTDNSRMYIKIYSS
ncbi:FirrV-1-A49 [Feldmannia irregularis virus a]|uniref:FirrV-1-A49 n=1 Tax=Feldmannia irregularis virus a TaxID=231992 RepID=Q6XM38_9PHYC|nr:FirrV-1-A49 [Feldmannia irregularis virus a]AAR26873.1 FirrV-1-A49 [Feldmannia irregularis virus a]